MPDVKTEIDGICDFEQDVAGDRDPNGAVPDTAPAIGIETTIFLDNILNRHGADTRGLSEDHVNALAESIGAIGLIEPLVVDNKGRLLAGGQRREAISRFKQADPQKYLKCFPSGCIPVRVMDFDSEEDPDRAFEVEVAENEHRRDYTKKEVREIAERLKAAGYTDTPGRPRSGEKRLKPALMAILGKSLRSVERYLSELDGEETPPFGGVSQGGLRDEIHQAYKKVRSKQTWRKIEASPALTRKCQQIGEELRKLLKDAESIDAE